MIIGPWLVVGGGLAVAVVVVPRFAGVWLFSLAVGIVLGVMLISFVAVPARMLGVKKAHKLPPAAAVDEPLSAVR